MKSVNYFLSKDNKSNDYVYIEYENLEGYNIKPKTTKKDAIKVNSIVFISKDFSEKLIRKKIEKRITRLVNYLKNLDDDSDDEDGIRLNLVEAERLKMDIIAKYVKYLGNTYNKYTMKKITIIVNELRLKLYDIKEKKQQLLEFEEEKEYNEKKGKRSR